MPFLAADSISLFENFEKNIDLVNGGTLFINNIEKLSHENQTVLLSLIKDKKIKHKNGFKDIAVRVLCATSHSLWHEVSGTGFKEALCQCLNGFNIIIPPLRQHREDILSFAMHFLRINNASLNKNLKGFSPQAQFFFLIMPGTIIYPN